MEEISDLESLKKCRLCGALGIHPIDILESDTAGPRNSNALSEKICRCVGIHVEANDMLTTKICGNCFAKINDFVLFRKICEATDKQLRIAMSNVTSHGSTAVSKVGTGATNSSNEIHLTNGESASATATNRTIDIRSLHSETSIHQATERIRRSAEPLVPLNSDGDAHPHKKRQESPRAAPTLTISLVEEGSENESDAANSDAVESISSEDIAAENEQMTSTGATDNTRNVDVKCQKNGPGIRCTELFDSLEAMTHHAETYHAKGVGKKFECHICRKLCFSRSTIQRHCRAVHYGSQ